MTRGLLQSTSHVALVAAASIFMGGLGVSSAIAADLGGDCCADLEERVADLEATTVRKGNRKVSLKVSGWLTREIGWLKDEDGNSEFYSAGNTNAGGRLKFSGSAKLSKNWKAGFALRFRTTGGRVGDVLTNAGASSTSANRTFGRDLEYVYLSNKQLGTFVVGQAYVPSKSISNISLGGHGVLNNSGKAWNKTGIQGFELEQNSNQSLVSWISPTIAGFTLAAAWADLDNDATSLSDDAGVDMIDVGLRYANEFGPIRVAGGISYTTTDHDKNQFGDVIDGANVTGSFALLHTPTGLNVDFSAGKEIDGGVNTDATDTKDKQFWHVAAGINQNFFGPGKTSIYGEYGDYDFDDGSANSVTVWGLGVVQHFDSAATELYVSYRKWEDKDVTTADTDVQQVNAGMRIKF